MKLKDDIIFTRSLYQNKVNIDIKSKASSTIVSFQSGAYKLDSINSGNSNVDINSIDLSTVEPKIYNEEKFKDRIAYIEQSMPIEISGKISSMSGLTMEVIAFFPPIGAVCEIKTMMGGGVPKFPVLGKKIDYSISDRT